MSEIAMIRTQSGGFVPMDDTEAEKIKRIKAGAVVRCDITQMRNGKFFRKWWVLAQFAFGIWSETMPQQEYKGRPVLPEFDRFRKDLTILAGYFRPVWAANGEMRVEAESLSWSSMDEDRFESLYSATINAILGKVLASSGLTDEIIRAHVDQVMRFDS